MTSRFDVSLFSDNFLSVQKQMVDLLEGWLRHKSDMVNFEAARAICEMKNVTSAQVTRSISGMFTFRSQFEALLIFVQFSNFSFRHQNPF